MKQGKWLRRLAGGISLFVALVAVDLFWPPPIKRADDLSVIVTDRNGYWLHAFATEEGRWRFAADLDQIDPRFIDELIAIEDKRFWSHHGVDIQAVARAGVSALSARRVVSGASTITMQTARLLEPRKRTIGAKLIEMVRAVQLERRLSKEEILELYLTLAPYGGNIEGVRAASLAYFSKEPASLTAAERALLIALPQAPEARRPDRRPQTAVAARNLILDRLAQLSEIDPGLIREAKAVAPPRARTVFPRIAYHAANEMAQAGKRGSEIRSTLDIGVQMKVETIIAEGAAAFDDGATAAAMVIDNATGDVLASVGSSGLDAAGGWIDLTDRRRSPGSLLKPFIYGLAMEDGVIGPDTILDDMPRGFSGYNPENFDRTFRGEVRVRDALQHSLNVPAVETLDQIGAARFANIISAAGARVTFRKRADSKPTLALALGGGGLTMREIGVLYASLANGGTATPLKWTLSDTIDDKSYRLFSVETASQINAILRGAPALAGRAPAALSASAPVVAFKTGTSYGFRDAWAAGHADGKTIIVWVGRADGAPRPGIAGRTVAAPLLFDLFDALTDGTALKPPEEEQAPGANDVRTRLRPRMLASAPVIKYPVPGSEVFADIDAKDRGIALAASGGVGEYRWYVDGVEIAGENRAIWRPTSAGFYDVTVVDGRGLSNTAKIRVASLQ